MSIICKIIKIVNIIPKINVFSVYNKDTEVDYTDPKKGVYGWMTYKMACPTKFRSI